jgi:hypothetical protein
MKGIVLFLLLAVNIYGQNLESYIIEQCNNNDVSVEIALAILAEENRDYDFTAVHHNRNGSMDLGLWQLNSNYLWTDFIPRFWDRRETFRWDNPYHNTYIAIRLIRWLYNKGFNHYQVIIAYNAGYKSIERAEVPESTINYAIRVFKRSGLWRE